MMGGEGGMMGGEMWTGGYGGMMGGGGGESTPFSSKALSAAVVRIGGTQ